MKNLNSGLSILIAAILLTACAEKESDPAATAPPSAETETATETVEQTPSDSQPDLRARLSADSRPAEDRARDASRKPAEVVEFLGIEPGMTVLDIIAAGGYYTEVLSIAVGPDGKVVAQNTDAALQYSDGANEKAISARLADNRLPNVSRLNKNFDEMSAADGPFDAAITALNFHDVYYGAGAESAADFMETIYSVLKPGGVLGVTDHVGMAGADNADLHRIEKSKVVDAATAAGFELEGESDVLRNEADDHSEQVFSDAIRGKTDRFVLKFRKPSE